MARLMGQQPSAWAEMSRGSLSMKPMAYRSLKPFHTPAMVQPSPTEMAMIVGHLPVQLLHDLQGHGLFALGEIGVDGGVAVVPAPLVDGGLGQLEGVLIVALDGDDSGAEDHQLGHLALGGAGGHEDVGLEARSGGVARQRARRRCRWRSRRWSWRRPPGPWPRPWRWPGPSGRRWGSGRRP